MEFEVRKLPRGLDDIKYSNNFLKFLLRSHLSQNIWHNVSQIFPIPIYQKEIKDSLPFRL